MTKEELKLIMSRYSTKESRFNKVRKIIQELKKDYKNKTVPVDVIKLKIREGFSDVLDPNFLNLNK